MKKIHLIYLLLSGCSNLSDTGHDFEVNEFTAVATATMYDLNRTKPNEVNIKNPVKELELLCSQYSFSPQRTRESMLNILAKTAYSDPMYSLNENDALYSHQKSDWDNMRTIISRKQADLAFQICLNAYRTKHGQDFVPVKLGSSELYSNPSWNK
ncbi:hypothetical protein [Citrobacter braakii]|uniref:hypothetical protein n=1 Tax=Citrobacter braakii TaxID=57706 RepID=UPI002B249889|nr:hypothetical protein [Citrobacter braakii]MEB2439826.1 hypothetical protein [Citrobacter braakii]